MQIVALNWLTYRLTNSPFVLGLINFIALLPVVTLDADGQHCPEEVERLVASILEDEVDFVIGTRFLGGYEERRSARHFGIVGFSSLISLLCGVRITDCTNGFRAIRASMLARMDLNENQFSAPELIIEAAGMDWSSCQPKSCTRN